MRRRPVIGLTGSVAMGKSTAAQMLARLGCPVHDADAVVHGLMAPGGAAVEPVSAVFADVVRPDGGLDRPKLGAAVFEKPEALSQLEGIIHPLVTADRARFFRRIGLDRRREPVILDIPLLFETGGQAECDFVLVVSAPGFVQRQRFLARPGATADRFDAILARQMPDWQKRRLADQIIPSGLGYAPALRALRRACRLAKSANRQTLRRAAARRRLRGAILHRIGGQSGQYAGNRS